MRTVGDKAEFLAVRPSLRDPLRILEKPGLTLHVDLERLTALSSRKGRAGMGSVVSGWPRLNRIWEAGGEDAKFGRPVGGADRGSTALVYVD